MTITKKKHKTTQKSPWFKWLEMRARLSWAPGRRFLEGN